MTKPDTSLELKLGGVEVSVPSGDKLYFKLPFQAMKQLKEGKHEKMLSDLYELMALKLTADESTLKTKMGSLISTVTMTCVSDFGMSADAVAERLESIGFQIGDNGILFGETKGKTGIEKPPKDTAMTAAELKKLMASPPVLLKTASQLYQPVGATSVNSKYFVVAQYGKIMMAARLTKEGTLSIRMEGPGLSEMLAQTEESGVDYKSGYASGHFHCASKARAIKTLGAVMMSMGRPSDLPFPDLNKIEGMGA